MSEKKENEQKKTLKNKLKEFEKQGLESYAKYLDEQLKKASKSDSKDSYKKYIENQIQRTAEKIERIESKLKK